MGEVVALDTNDDDDDDDVGVSRPTGVFCLLRMRLFPLLRIVALGIVFAYNFLILLFFIYEIGIPFFSIRVKLILFHLHLD